MAGPIPAPFFLIPANNGSIVQEQTANKSPAIMDNGYALYLGTFLPRYFVIFSFKILVKERQNMLADLSSRITS